MKPLYELSIEYQSIMNDVIELQEISEEQMTMLDQITSDIKQKAINIGAIIKNMEYEAEAIDKAIETMEERRKRLVKKSERLKDYLKNKMEECQLKEVKSPHFDIKLKTNPDAVNTYNVALIPQKYIREIVVQNIDKNSIKYDIKNNIFVPGACLEKRVRLDIR